MATRYVVVGGGPAATNALQTIRQYDAQADLTFLSDEPAHSRMALPYWIAGAIPREQVLTGNDALWKKMNVAAHSDARVRAIHPYQHEVETVQGQKYGYDRLLLATGSRPRQLAIPGADDPRVQPLWNLHHVESLLQSVPPTGTPRVAMIGAGFIGFIVLNAMYKRGWKLSVIEQQPHVLPRMLNADAAGIVQGWLSERGVDVHCGAGVKGIEADGATRKIQLDNGNQLEVDVVIVAVGVQPNLELAGPAGIETDQGILVDAHLRTNLEHIYAAGDVAQGPVLHTNERAVHAIQPTAVDHGRVAGANMAGQSVAYPGSLSMNVLDVCGLQCVSYGLWDADVETMSMINPAVSIYRNLVWEGDRLCGAIFVGRANDVGMLSDAGMVKGFLQTNTAFGAWKKYVDENPFDIRRPYIATGVAEQLKQFTLLPDPSASPAYRDASPQSVRRERPHMKTFQPSDE